MEEILHQLGFLRAPVHDGINYQNTNLKLVSAEFLTLNLEVKGLICQ